jgi:hypothetical protein
MGRVLLINLLPELFNGPVSFSTRIFVLQSPHERVKAGILQEMSQTIVKQQERWAGTIVSLSRLL